MVNGWLGEKNSRGNAIGSPKMTSFGFKNTPRLTGVELEQRTASKTVLWDCFRPLLNISVKYYYGRQALLWLPKYSQWNGNVQDAGKLKPHNASVTYGP